MSWFIETAYAHEGIFTPPPADVPFQTFWQPVWLAIFLVGLLYWRGLRAFRGERGCAVKTVQRCCFYLGLVVVLVALVPPIDTWSGQLFWMHMVQHLLISGIGVPLIILGAPFYVIVRGISPGVRRQVYFPLIRNRFLRACFRLIDRPLVALILYQANFIFWHVPLFYNLALINPMIHLVQHAGFSVCAVILWRQMFDPYPMRAKLPLPARILFLASVMASSVALAAFLTFSDSVWYIYRGRPMPGWWTFSQVEDQHLGGLLMWVPGEAINLAIMTVIFFLWVGRERRREALRMRELDAADSRRADILSEGLGAT